MYTSNPETRRPSLMELEGLDNTPVPDYTDLTNLESRGFVVVGGGRGMGRQTSHAIAAHGGTVFCVDIDRDRAEAVAKEVGGIPHVADVRNASEVDSMVDRAVAELGSIDGLVDIVGMARYARLIEMPEDDWDWVHGMVIRHAFLLMRSVGRVMTERGRGSMVFIASMSGIASAPFHAAYGVAKAGLVHLVRSAAWEMRESEVRVNAVAPGSIATPRVAWTKGVDPAEIADGRLVSMGQTSDIAAAVLFFLCDLSKYVTGQILSVDGGLLARYPLDFEGPLLPAGQAMGDVS
jgi:NAD(P)-dependent dehydrogenase (short-subunit alcohol dehydrogenase family)